jgi:hypothetical protein
LCATHLDDDFQRRQTIMIQQNLPWESNLPPPSIINELSGAQDQLAQLSVLLRDAYRELLNSFSAVQVVARETGSVPEIDQFVGHAVAALHYEDRASQLIGLTLSRLTLARDSLKNLARVPKMDRTKAELAAGIATCAGLTGAAPPQHRVSRNEACAVHQA